MRLSRCVREQEVLCAAAYRLSSKDVCEVSFRTALAIFFASRPKSSGISSRAFCVLGDLYAFVFRKGRRQESTAWCARMLVRTSHYPDRRLDGRALLFAALGNETRLKLIESLCGGGLKSINQLTLGLPISRQNVGKHLRILASAGWVRDVKVGRERLWKFDPSGLAEAHRSLELIGGRWECTLGKLKVMVPGHSEARERVR